MKHTLKLLLACVILFATACEKDESPVKISTSVEDVKKAITVGFWQLEQSKYEGTSSLTTEEYYETAKYFDNDEYDMYYTKSGKYNDRPWKYRIKSLDGKTVLVRYSTVEDYNDDYIADYNAFLIEIEGKKMTMTRVKNGEVFVYHNFDSVSATKDKKIGS